MEQEDMRTKGGQDGARPSDQAGQATPEAASASSPSGDHPSRVSFNVNESVWVKLTAEGLAEHRRRHDEYHAAWPETFHTYHPPKVDGDGWTKIQLWALMSSYGSLMRMGAPVPFETTIQIDAIAIEAPSGGETGTGSTEGESAGLKGIARKAQDHDI